MSPDAYTITSTGRWICRGPYDFRHPTGSGIDAGLARDAAGLVRVSDGSSGRGSLRVMDIDVTGDVESHGTSSTSTLRLQAYQRGGFYDSTDATRKGKVERYATDVTADRMTDTAASDGSRGYFIPMVHTTAPPDAMLPNNSGCIFMDSGTPKLRYKDNSGAVSTISLGGGMVGP